MEPDTKKQDEDGCATLRHAASKGIESHVPNASVLNRTSITLDTPVCWGKFVWQPGRLTA